MKPDDDINSISSNDGNECVALAAAPSAPVAVAAVAKRKKKRRLEEPSFTDRYASTGVELGSGSYGRVREYRDMEKEDRLVAVKMIDKGSNTRARVLNEVETFHLCKGHDNILQLLDFYEDSARFCLVFEKMEGGPLLDHIKARNCFSEAEASRVVADLARALQFLHSRGIAHRDLKPENVLCVRKDSPNPVKLCDFDLCSRAPNILDTTPKLQTPVGSLEFMAPEVLKVFRIREDSDDDDEEEEEEELSYDKKCDLWSLGVLLYILLSGDPPFVGRCGRECGWDNGDCCSRCQALLSSSIRSGDVNLAGEVWDAISEDAKDLVRRLLDRNTVTRIDTRGLQSHPWICANEGSGHLLGTPGRLSRQNSLRDLADFANTAMSINREINGSNNSRNNSSNNNSNSHNRSISLDMSLAKSAMLQRRRNRNGRKMKDFSSIEENDGLQ